MIETADRGAQTDSCAGLTPCDKGRILLVDDEESIVKIFTIVIGMNFPALALDTAENGQVAVDLFAQRHHGLVLLDVRMPVMDGERAYQAIDRLCAERRWEMPGVIFCTGFVLPDSLRKAAARRCHYVIEKPVGLDLLVEAIRLGLGQTEF